MILITGGTGFVGRHLQEELRRRGTEYVLFSKRDYDLTRQEGAEAVFARHRDVGAVIHLASYQAAADFPAKHPAEQFHVNNLIHSHTLEAWRRFAPQARFLAVGTSCAYPSAAASLTEEVFLDGDIHGSVYSYAFTKRLLYTGVRAYNDQYKLNGSYIIPATMFGEYDDFHPETAHVAGALIGKFVRAVQEKLPEVEIWGDGTQVREFMDVEEFVKALLHLLERADRDVVNVGPGMGTTIRELAETICRAAGFEGRLRFNPGGYVGIKGKMMNVEKLNNKYQYRIGTDISKGIRRTVAWYSHNYARLKDRRKFEGAEAGVRGGAL